MSLKNLKTGLGRSSTLQQQFKESQTFKENYKLENQATIQGNTHESKWKVSPTIF